MLHFCNLYNRVMTKEIASNALSLCQPLHGAVSVPRQRMGEKERVSPPGFPRSLSASLWEMGGF